MSVMKKMALCILLIAAIPACQKPLFDSSSRESQGGRRISPPASAQDSTEAGLTVYATAIVFPDSTDWRAGDTRAGKVILFKDGKAIGSLPAEDRPDPDRHRFMDGHLWTDVTDGTTTTILCDGAPLFSFPGQESMTGFLVADGSVHTLGQHPGGGFSYRIDGQEIYSSADGVAVGKAEDPDWEGGTLTRDDTGIYYAYSFPVHLQDGQVWEHRVMKGGEMIKLLPALAGGELLDIRVRDEKVYRLENRYGNICFLKGETIVPINIPVYTQSVRLVWVDGEMQVRGYSRYRSTSVHWIMGGDGFHYAQVTDVNHLFHLFASEGKTAYVVLNPDESVAKAACGETEEEFPPATYRLKTRRCAAYKKGVLALALTNEVSNEHLLVVDGQHISSRFNGYFTGIYIY